MARAIIIHLGSLGANGKDLSANIVVCIEGMKSRLILTSPETYRDQLGADVIIVTGSALEARRACCHDKLAR